MMQGDQTEQSDAPEVESGAEQDGDGIEVVVEDHEDQADQPIPEAAPAKPEEPRESAIARAILELQDQVKRSHDSYVRAVADADNYRKRSRRDIKDAVDRAEDRVVCSFLPVIDNLERALAHAEGEGCQSAEGLVKGVRMVQKQFEQTLERFGIKSFASVGEPFDPELHEAIQQMHSEHPANTVAMELHRGYKREKRLVRPAMVAVSLGPAEPSPDDTDGDTDRDVVGVDEKEANEKLTTTVDDEGNTE